MTDNPNKPEESEEAPAAAVDLMAALKASLDRAKKARAVTDAKFAASDDRHAGFVRAMHDSDIHTHCERVGLHNCAVHGEWRNHDRANDMP